MNIGSVVPVAAGVVVFGKCATQFWLERLNRAHVLAHAQAVPEAFKEVVDEGTYQKSVQYTLARARLHEFELSFDGFFLLLLLFTPVLPRTFSWFNQWRGSSAWAMAAFLFSIGVVMSLVTSPFEWYHQFRLEERFGFNTTTQKVWWLDRLKGLLLAILLGYPLMVLVLKLVEWTRVWWWFWAWVALLLFQLLMLVL